MGNLFGTMSIAVQSLLVDQGALQVTSNNIANANTPGYSREEAVLTEGPVVDFGSLQFGQGVTLEQVQGIRDQVLEYRIQQGMQEQGQLDAYLGAANQVQSIFNEAQGAGLQNPLSQFFNSLQALSANPSDASLRQAVLSAAQTLASTFHTAASGLATIQSGLNQGVTQAVDQINQLTQQIASANAQVVNAQHGGRDPSPFIDQRNQLIEQLSSLVEVSVVNANDGSVTLTTSNGTLLVAGQQSFALQAQIAQGTGNQDVFANGTDITSSIRSGQLGGLIQARDDQTVGVAAAQSSLDNLAYSLTSAFNTQHSQGFDLSGAPGGNFFTPLTQVAGSAANFNVAITDQSKIAASSDGTPGNNGNALALAGIQNQAIINGQSVTDFYANFVAGIGTQVSQATNQQTAQNLALQQMDNQRASISGVSLDEEASNLVKYQTAYEASARVVAIINSLAQTAINLGLS